MVVRDVQRSVPDLQNKRTGCPKDSHPLSHSCYVTSNYTTNLIACQ